MSDGFPVEFTPQGDVAPPNHGYNAQGDPIYFRTNDYGDIYDPGYGVTPQGDRIPFPTNDRGDVIYDHRSLHPELPEGALGTFDDRELAWLEMRRRFTTFTWEIDIDEFNAYLDENYLQVLDALASHTHFDQIDFIILRTIINDVLPEEARAALREQGIIYP